MLFHADLEAREAFLRTAFLRVPAAIAAIDLEGRIIACNPAYGEIVGIATEDLTGVDATAFVHPDDLERAIEASIGHFDGDESTGIRVEPIRMLRPDRTTVWVRFNASFIDDGDRDPYVLSMMTDVSAQVESEQALARSEAWFHALLEHQSDIVTVVGLDGVVQYTSPNCEQIVGFTAEELLELGSGSVHPDDLVALIEGLDAQLHRRELRPIEYRHRRRDGSWLWLEAVGRELPSDLGPEAVIVTSRDVTERRRSEARARAAQDRFRSAFATSPLGIGLADLDGRLEWVNAALVETVGIAQSQLLTMSFEDFSNESDLELERCEVLRLLRGESDSFSVDKRYEHPDGRTIWTRLHVSLVHDADGSPVQLLGQLEDVTDRKQLELSLSHDAVHDPLTGLFNRAGLRQQVDAAWEARRPGAPMAILFGDLDGFKQVNDRLGHDAGDEVLVHVAQRLCASVRAGDVVARWGGDEFVVVCPSVSDSEDAVLIADRIRAALDEPLRIGPGLAQIAISVGVALDTGQPLPDLLVKDADAAAYRAKLNGRNQVVLAGPVG